MYVISYLYSNGWIKWNRRVKINCYCLRLRTRLRLIDIIKIIDLSFEPNLSTHAQKSKELYWCMKRHHFSIIWQRFNYVRLLDTRYNEEYLCVSKLTLQKSDPLSRTSHSLLFERPRSYLFLFLQSSMSATRRRLVHVYAGSKVSTERRMDHALCIIHHVIGSLSDSTPCRCYRVPRHGTARPSKT